METKQTKQSIISFINSETNIPIIELKTSGEIFVKGKPIETDKELVDAMKEFLKDAGYIK